MPLEQMIPQLLAEHIQLDRWERPAELVRLIAVWTPWPPAAVEITRADLMAALGRDEEQARYDHKVMVRLAERDRILSRKRGHPDAWRVDVRSGMSGHWRNVPWRTSRAAFARDLGRFFRLDAGKARPVGGNGAGHGGQTVVNTPPTANPADSMTSANGYHLLAGHYHQVASQPGKTGPQSPPTGQPAGAPVLSPVDTPSSYRRDDDGSSRSEAARQLIEAVKAVLGCPIYGRPAAQLAAMADAAPERVPQLIERARVDLRNLRAPTLAAQLLADAAAGIGAPNPGSAVDLEGLLAGRRRFRTALDDDDERATQVDAEIADLERQLSAS